MKHTLLFTLTLIVSINCNTVAAQQQDTVFVSNFGAHVYSYTNSVTNIQAAINECKRTGAHVLSFEKRPLWHLAWRSDTQRIFHHEYFDRAECPSKVKTIGLLFEDMKDLIIEGKGATLMFHGKMTTIALEHCKNLTFQNLQVDFWTPCGIRNNVYAGKWKWSGGEGASWYPLWNSKRPDEPLRWRLEV